MAVMLIFTIPFSLFPNCIYKPPFSITERLSLPFYAFRIHSPVSVASLKTTTVNYRVPS